MDEAAKSSDGCAESIDEYGKEVKKAGEDSEEAGKKFDKVKTAATALGTAAAAATAALAAAAIKLGKEVISAYADYEQLVGGVETLFKDSSGKVMEYANDAYKTAGLSANEYMETVTGFSASLISSLGGDTEKAAEYANMAITEALQSRTIPCSITSSSGMAVRKRKCKGSSRTRRSSPA